MTANMVWYSMTKGNATLATACSLKKNGNTNKKYTPCAADEAAMLRGGGDIGLAQDWQSLGHVGTLV